MKPLKPIAFDFPLKGLDINWGRDKQPKNTAPALRNVLPYESNIARGGQRLGNSKILATAFGSGNKIDALWQATLALEPGATDTDAIFEDDFTARIGTFLSSDVNVGYWSVGTCTGTNADSIDQIFNHSTLEIEAALNQTDGIVQDFGDGTGAVAYDFSHGGIWDAKAFLDPVSGDTIPTPEIYRISADLVSSDVQKLGLYTGWRGSFAQAGGTVVFYIDHANTQAKLVVLADGGGLLATLDTDTFSVAAGTECRLTLEVDRSTSPPTFTGYVDGVQLLQATSSQSGVDTFTGRAGIIHTRRTGVLTGNSYMARNFLVEANVVVGKDSVGFRDTKLVIASNGSVYSGPITAPALATSGTGVYTAGYSPCMTDIDGKVYIVDGTPSSDVKILDLSTNTISTLTAASGKGTTPTGCRIAVTYFGALVLAKDQNIFLMRVGDPTDALYGQTDELSAVELNASTAGHIGQIVLALCPFRDDVMLIGCDHSIYALTGHPAASGRIDTVSDSIGMYGQEAWTVAPDGSIYFVGSGGFYKYNVGQGIVNLSLNRLGNLFTDINRKRNQIKVCYDRDHHGVNIFITPTVSYAAAYGLWYDERLDAFFPIDYPATHGPTALLVFDGDASKDRYIILGGRDGYLRKLDTSLTDDGTAIVSDAWLGPYFPVGPGNDIILQCLEPTPSNTTTNLDYGVYTGDDAQTARNNEPSYTGTWTSGGRLGAVRKTARGCCFFLRLQNDTEGTTWGWEGATGLIRMGGKLRKLR